MSKQAYEFTSEMREISGFGGKYEEACRAMLTAALNEWDRQQGLTPDFAPRFSGVEGFYGLAGPGNPGGEIIIGAMTEAADGPTGAMVEAVLGHLLAIREHGWDWYVEKMSKPDEPPVDSHAAAALDRKRPYNGQPHTDSGERGKTHVEGLTYRDVRDCFILACYESSGLPRSKWPTTVYELPWDDMDIIAIAQNLTCEMEKRQGIYPNVPPLEDADA